MRNHRRSPTLGREFILIPEGVNPFGYFAEQVSSKFFPGLSNFTTALLVIFFIFHLVIASFCLAILVLSQLRRKKRSQWFFRRLHLRDRSGRSVSKVPLLWVNAGLLMTISQFLGSVASQAFILINIKWKQSVHYALHHPVEPALGVMLACEIFSYWALMHCFVVAICYDQNTRGEIRNRVARWMASPPFINCIFFFFPLAVVVTILTLSTCLTLVNHKFEKQVIKGLTVLAEGSDAWEKLKVPTGPPEEQVQLTRLILQVASEAKSLKSNANMRLEEFTDFFHVTFCVLLTLHCITFLVFLCMFWLVASKFQRKERELPPASPSPNPFRRWARPKEPQITSADQPLSSNRSLMHIATSNRQFLHLLLRAICIFIAMSTNTIVLSIGVLKTHEVLRTPKWRGLLVWLAAVAGSWSSIPIAWQCWRLYKDDSAGSSPGPTQLKDGSSGRQDDQPTAPFQPEPDEIEIRLGPLNEIRVTLSSDSAGTSEQSPDSVGTSEEGRRTGA